MASDRDRTGDWTGDQWARDETTDQTTTEPDETTTQRVAGTPADRWVKTEWVGDQGEGAPSPVDPDTMPEGERGLSGDRHSPSEEHWAGTHRDARTAGPGDRPLKQ